MNLAFALFQYAPYGGLEQIFLRVASACRERGHAVHVFTLRCRGELPQDFQLSILSTARWQNHARRTAFSRLLAKQVAATDFDAVIGFNKMPGLDIYFAADGCDRAHAFEERSWLYRWMPRCRNLLELERRVFAPEERTQILLMVESEREVFRRYYQTPLERFHVLPPGIPQDRLRPPDALQIRRAVREKLGLGMQDAVALMVGSDFKRKGLDRAVYGLAALPQILRQRSWLLVAGRGQERPFRRLAERLGVEERLRILGARDDVPQLLWSADLLVHPAYREAAGMALLEGIAAGVPVLTTEGCGYAVHVQRAGAGVVIPLPFEQNRFNAAFAEMLSGAGQLERQQNALAYAAAADLFGMPERTVHLIEHLAPRLRPVAASLNPPAA